MQRGVYFDAWFPRQHCYHPSLPPRRLRMIDDLVDYRATTLVWASLGGGSISLPYLEQEAFGPVDARSRFYGFVNDSEFIAAAQQRGIKVFGIVFEAQGWEFPAEFTAEEDEILALNELRGAGHRGWLGLREFTQNRYPKLWKPFESYFPGGLVNSDGEPVTDLIEECCARDIHQTALHARWVECPDREHQCYYMDRNNPVWREYLKAVIRIQIDAGVDGVQLDETELPLGSLQYGGCFCKDCVKGFAAYLKALPENERSPLLADVDLDTFHYGTWLLRQGYDFTGRLDSTPLYPEYYRFQCEAIRRHFGELATHARDYARSQGREVLVSGNFFNMDPQYLGLADDVDVIVTEMRNTTYRQPEWYRYVAGFAGDKDVIVVENPYGGVVPELVDLLRAGKGHDLLRLSCYEAAAFGVNMAVPYGAWMGATIQDAFYAPHDVAAEVQGFLADNERLFDRDSRNEVAVVYSVESNRALIARQDIGDNLRNARDESVRVPYRQVTEALAAAAVPFDVVIFPDARTAPDRITAESLRRYDTVLLPACTYLTAAQVAALRGYLDGGGRLVRTGGLGDNLAEDERAELTSAPGMSTSDPADLSTLLPHGPQIELAATAGTAAVAANTARLADGSVAVHLVNYDYRPDEDAVRPLSGLDLRVRLSERLAAGTAYSCDGKVTRLDVRVDGGIHAVTLDALGPYAVVVFEGGAE
ncbi:hypothetical protein EAD89_05975 [Micromonospora sp. BL4]|uniref:hypothetical protein n=1 Tax=Micromonospora sp. BL4 TaxID=2478710 RepID=UPI000EF5FC3F|nr:hypothetical protein [Micromonospora sp. BL4]RLP93565.1 hypothetical protein EAD89_05975 [Micromonospora sp. BL4]